MSEQRYGYTYHRVLIDSARILDPQFDDAVIYVTGAQLEMLRNMTQYLIRLSTYVSDYQPGYYLSPTIEDYDTIVAIVADLEETLMGNPNTIWGYKDRFVDQQFEWGTDPTPTDCVMDPVPAGYVYVVEHWTIQHLGGAPLGVILYIDEGGGAPVLYTAPALPSAEIVYQLAHLTLKEGDSLIFRVHGLAGDKTCSMFVWGHMMAVP